MGLGAEDFREAAIVRLKEAQLLYENEQWIGSIYLAGRAVECILRSMLWKPDGPMETGHDLPKTLDKIRESRLLNRSEIDGFDELVNEIAIVWRNDLRYTGSNRFKRLLNKSGRDRYIGGQKVMGDASKANALKIKNVAEKTIARGEPICRRRSKTG